MTTKDGQERAFTVEENGTISSLEVALAETPTAVQKTVTAQVGAGKLDSIARIFDETTTYDVEMTAADGKEREFSVGADGRLLSIRVTLEETNADVQKTIKEQIGTGRLLRIDKSFVKKNKVEPYEVEALKNGKPFYFSVGPKGRFLGVDE
jgi:N-methylhydantoinase A/oxoprolinase/acetone carboxylase beta subunit